MSDQESAKTVTIPVSVYEAMQAEIHSLRGMLTKIGAHLTIIHRDADKQGEAPSGLVLQTFFMTVERLVREQQKNDYRQVYRMGIKPNQDS